MDPTRAYQIPIRTPDNAFAIFEDPRNDLYQQLNIEYVCAELLKIEQKVQRLNICEMSQEELTITFANVTDLYEQIIKSKQELEKSKMCSLQSRFARLMLVYTCLTLRVTLAQANINLRRKNIKPILECGALDCDIVSLFD